MVRIENTEEQDRAIIREISLLMDKENAFSLFLNKIQGGNNIDFAECLQYRKKRVSKEVIYNRLSILVNLRAF
jgi:hypothetical protein